MSDTWNPKPWNRPLTDQDHIDRWHESLAQYEARVEFLKDLTARYEERKRRGE